MKRLLFSRRLAQSGVALLALVILLTLAGLAWFAQTSVRLNEAGIRAPIAERALAEAKAALLGHAAAYPELADKRLSPGALPCPDQGGGLELEGVESGTCGSEGVAAIGHFPWRSLGLPPPRDGVGECLWYLVSGAYKTHAAGRLLNPDIPARLRIEDADGRLLAHDAVAVLFAPGAPLAGQDRADGGGECRKDYVPRRYLEGLDNASPNATAEGVTRLLQGRPGATANDRLLWISRDELFAAIAKRADWPQALFDPDFPAATLPVGTAAHPEIAAYPEIALTQRVAACLARFGATNARRRLPWAAPLVLGGSGPDRFKNDAFADRQAVFAGRPPFLIARSQDSLRADLGKLAACASGNTNCRLLRVENCPELAPVMGETDPYGGGRGGWFERWKDHLFYVVAPGFAPEGEATDCTLTPGLCLEVNGRFYAAAVLFSAAPTGTQRRENDADRMNADNYLEGRNAESVRLQGQRLERAGNDRIVCIEANRRGDEFTLVPDCG